MSHCAHSRNRHSAVRLQSCERLENTSSRPSSQLCEYVHSSAHLSIGEICLRTSSEPENPAFFLLRTGRESVSKIGFSSLFKNTPEQSLENPSEVVCQPGSSEAIICQMKTYCIDEFHLMTQLSRFESSTTGATYAMKSRKIKTSLKNEVSLQRDRFSPVPCPSTKFIIQCDKVFLFVLLATLSGLLFRLEIIFMLFCQVETK